MSQTEYVLQPHERPMMPGSPATPDHPTGRRIAYGLIGLLLGLTGGLGTALVSANITNLQGSLGLYTKEIAWLPTVYIMGNISMNLLLIKFRQQYGLRLFAQIFLVAYALAAVAHLFVDSFASTIMVRVISGMAGAALSTFGLFYFIQAMPAAHRLKGLVLGIAIPQLATPLARVFSTDLLEYGEWHGLYMFEAGLALLCLAAVGFLRLPPSERVRVFERLDFVTFALFAPGIAMLCAVLGQGRLEWWSEAPWIGYALVGSIILLTTALLIEHFRANPLINTRWLGSGDIARFAVVAILVRVVLSEQTYGSVGLLQVLGLGSDQLRGLFMVILLGSIAGVVASVLTLDPTKLSIPVMISLVLIAVGAFMDAGSTNLTRPQNMYFSQLLLAFAATFFMGPALLFGISRALARGPAYIVSFSVLFGITQNIGGLAGSAFLGTFQVFREKFHSNALVSDLTLADPLVVSRIQAGSGAYARTLTDPALRGAEGAALLSQQITREANVLAFNDVFLLIGVLSLATFAWLVFLYFRNLRRLREAAAAEAQAQT